MTVFLGKKTRKPLFMDGSVCLWFHPLSAGRISRDSSLSLWSATAVLACWHTDRRSRRGMQSIQIEVRVLEGRDLLACDVAKTAATATAYLTKFGSKPEPTSSDPYVTIHIGECDSSDSTTHPCAPCGYLWFCYRFCCPEVELGIPKFSFLKSASHSQPSRSSLRVLQQHLLLHREARVLYLL